MVYPPSIPWRDTCKRGMAQLDLSLFYQTNPGSESASNQLCA